MTKNTKEWLFIFLLVTTLGIICLCNVTSDLDNPFGIIGIMCLSYAVWIFWKHLMMKL